MNEHSLALALALGLATAASTAAALPATAANLRACLHGTCYKTTILVSNKPSIPARQHDANLVNPWGLAFGPEYAWVANNGTQTLTLYDGKGEPQPLVVNIPAASSGPANPTGLVFNDSPMDFRVTAHGVTGAAQFITAGQGGTIAAWSGAPGFGTTAVTVYDGGDEEALYTGLALLDIGGHRFLYAADFHNGEIEAFDKDFTEIETPGGFEDAQLPEGYAPFNIQAVKDKLIVTYAKQEAPENEEEVAGPGLGYVDVYDGAGHLLKRLISGGKLNAPWGVALAPDQFGALSGKLLIGNFGDGRINAYDPVTGGFVATLQTPSGSPVVIEGLWALRFGNGEEEQPTNTLFFTAGTHDEKDGSYGRIDTLPLALMHDHKH